jgi:hypothetical protein
MHFLCYKLQPGHIGTLLAVDVDIYTLPTADYFNRSSTGLIFHFPPLSAGSESYLLHVLHVGLAWPCTGCTI